MAVEWTKVKGCMGLEVRHYPTGESYRLRHYYNGKMHRDFFGVMNLPQAVRVAAELRANREAGTGPQSWQEMEGMRLQAVKAEKIKEAEEITQTIKADEFKRQNTVAAFWSNVYWPKKQKKISPKQVKTVDGHFRNWICPAVGDVPLTEFSITDLEFLHDYIANGKAARKKKPPSPKTIKNILGDLQAMYNWAMIHFSQHFKVVLPAWPIKLIDIEKADNKKTGYLSYEEASQLLATLRVWYAEELGQASKRRRGPATRPLEAYYLDAYGMATIALFTGLRFGNIAKLTWSDVRADGTIKAKKAKSGQDYFVHITPPVREMLNERKALYGDNPHERIFNNSIGGQYTEVPDIFEQAVIKLGINNAPHRIGDEKEKINFHSLRHTFASWAMASGTEQERVMRLLNHANREMTERYAHLAPDFTRAGAQAVYESFENNKK